MTRGVQPPRAFPHRLAEPRLQGYSCRWKTSSEDCARGRPRDWALKHCTHARHRPDIVAGHNTARAGCHCRQYYIMKHFDTLWNIVQHRITSTLRSKGVFYFFSPTTVDKESQSGNSISEKPVNASPVSTIVNWLASVRTSAPKTVGNHHSYSVLVWVGLGELCCLWESKLD